MKIFESFQKKLTIEYVCKYLRNKGFATTDIEDNSFDFKAYDNNWFTSYDKGRYALRLSFGIDGNIDMDVLIRAANDVNLKFWVIKCFVDVYSKDVLEKQDCQPSERLYGRIYFNCEAFCERESEFERAYEFGINAIQDAINYHRNAYNQYMEEKKTKSTNPQRIGFQASTSESSDTTPTAQTTPRKIGFSL